MVTALISAVMLLSMGVQEAKPPQESTEPAQSPYIERDQRQFTFFPGGTLQITTGVAGNVKIIGWGRSAVMLQVERIVHNLGPDQAMLLSSQYPVPLHWDQTLATLRTSGPPKSAVAMDINLTIYVPKEKTDIKAQILKGDLALGAINGWIEANLVEGGILAKSMSGDFSATTKHGDISVEMAGPRWRGSEFSAATQNGSVDLALPADFSAMLNLETRNGKIEVHYPEQKVDGELVPLPVIAKKNAQSLTGAVGEGGASIKLLTMSGDVKLSTISLPAR